MKRLIAAISTCVLRGDDNVTLNPHMTAYFSYATLVLQARTAAR